MICKEVLVWGLATTRFNLRNETHDKNKTKWRMKCRQPPPRAEEKLAPKKLVRRRQLARDPDQPRQLAAPRKSEAVGAGNDVARKKEAHEEELPTSNEEQVIEEQAAVAKASGVPRLSHGSHHHPTRGKIRHFNMSAVPKLRFECKCAYSTHTLKTIYIVSLLLQHCL
jgi:hypothetical protein